jgi:hypothetical protein
MMRIEVNVKDVVRTWTGYQRTLPKGARRGVWNVTRRLQKELKMEVQNQGLIWRGKLLKSIQARKLSKNMYGIYMPYYGEHLDRMPTHWVSLRRGRLITQWAMDKLGKQTGAIQVHAHPFIQTPLMKVRRQAKRIVEKEINRAIRGKGK